MNRKSKIVFITFIIVLICLLASIFIINLINKKLKKNDDEKRAQTESMNENVDNNADDSDQYQEITISKKEDQKITEEMTQLTESYKDLFSETYDQSRRDKIAKRLADQNKIVTTNFYEGVMKNHEQMDTFCKNVQSKSKNNQKVSVYYVQVNGGLLRYDFDYKDGKIIFTASSSEIRNNVVTVPFTTRYQLYQYSYTDNGWFFFEKYTDSDDLNTHTGIKVLTQDKRYIDLCNKYISPIGYDHNNLFIINWDQSTMDQIAFNDLYLFLNHMQNQDDAHSHDIEEKIQAKDFENIVTRYFQINSEKLKEFSSYDFTTDSYQGSTLTCIDCNPDLLGSPFPEVVNVVDHGDGTITLTVNVIWEWYNTDQAFTHDVTIKETEDGSFYYISNTVHPSENNIIPIYHKAYFNSENNG